jgi:hypothetical protein
VDRELPLLEVVVELLVRNQKASIAVTIDAGIPGFGGQRALPRQEKEYRQKQA